MEPEKTCVKKGENLSEDLHEAENEKTIYKGLKEAENTNLSGYEASEALDDDVLASVSGGLSCWKKSMGPFFW